MTTLYRPGNAQESDGYEELPELRAVVIDRALHDEAPQRARRRLMLSVQGDTRRTVERAFAIA